MSATKRPILQSKALTSGDPDTRDLLRQLADGHQQAIEIQKKSSGFGALRINDDDPSSPTIEVSLDGKTWVAI